MIRFSKTLYFSFTLMSCASAFARDMCEVDTRSERVMPLDCKNAYGAPGYPVWWSKPDPRASSQDYFYSCDDSMNVRLNLANGQQSPVPGIRDAVPTPDGRFLTVSGNGQSMNFYKINSDDPNEYPLVRDTTMNHAYQTMAILSSNRNQTNYRVVIDDDRGGVLLKDYRVRHEPDGRDVFDERDISISSHPSPVCTSITMKNSSEQSTLYGGRPAGFKLKLPMLSKDGKMLSAFDPVNQTTRIYEINPNNPSQCREKVNLGIPTGKPEFSYSGKEIVFHTSSQPGLGGWFRFEGRDGGGPNWNTLEWNAQVYTINLETLEMKQVSTRNANSPKYGSSFFPSYKQDGSIVYMRGNGHFQKMEGSDNESFVPRFEVVTVDPRTAGAQEGLPLERAFLSGCDSRSEFAALVALGMLWNDACTKYINDRGPVAIPESTLAIHALSLDPKLCRKQVAKLWENQERKETLIAAQKRYLINGMPANWSVGDPAEQPVVRQLEDADFASLTKEDLEAACPSA